MGGYCYRVIIPLNTVSDAEHLDNTYNHYFEFDKRDDRVWFYTLIIPASANMVFPERDHPCSDDL